MLTRKVLGFHYGGSEAALNSYRWDLLSTLAYFSYEVDPATGLYSSINGWDTTGAIAAAHQNGSKIILTVTNLTGNANQSVLSDPAKQQTLIASIVETVSTRGGDGVLVDFENVPAALGDNFTAFMTALATQLRQVVPLAEVDCALPGIPGNAYDLAALNNICDFLFAMTYDYSYSGSANAGPVSPLSGNGFNVTNSLNQYLANGVTPSRLLMGVPYYGRDWVTADETPRSTVVGDSKATTYSQNTNLAAQYGRNFDNTSSCAYITYIDGNGENHVLWYDDAASLELKYAIVAPMNIGGIGIWNLTQGQNVPELWQAISNAFAQ